MWKINRIGVIRGYEACDSNHGFTLGGENSKISLIISAPFWSGGDRGIAAETGLYYSPRHMTMTYIAEIKVS